MTAIQKNVSSLVDITVAPNIVVTAAAGSAGQAITYNGPTAAAFTIVNTSTQYAIEYRCDGKAWQYLGKGVGARIVGNPTNVFARLINDGATSVQVELSAEGLPTAGDGFPVVPSGLALTASNTQFPNYAKALAELAAGQSAAGVNVGIIGDSLTVGQYALTSAQAGVAPFSLARLLAGMTGGTDNATFGGIQKSDGNIGNLIASDSRITQGAGTSWVCSQLGPKVIGGGFDYVGASAGAPLTFTPDAPWDTVDIYFVTNTAYGTAAVSGAVTGTLNTAGALGLGVLTLTKAHGNGAVTLTPNGTGQIHVVGINCYSKTIPKLNFLKMGVGNSTSGDWADSAANWRSVPALQLFMATSKVPLWIIQLGTNDMMTNVPVATFQTNLQTVVTTVKRTSSNLAGGDVVLMVPPPIPFGTKDEALQMSFRDAIYEVAGANGLRVIDNYVDYVNPANGSARGWYSTVHSLHMNAAGYGQTASNVYKSIVSYR
ncbi:SGNH/GDSL hydrolase family protein [Pseudoduganella chitinolytica]|uniref:SGNH/GDSL hydrolase family protein n=1 Tax=Pseudoduganella chitinolytica TaxID=34070 RepID=A0ABY8BKF7_9BURK|nr:SGNH/GDSL hydrolase family protein [Pseudoduganella chitinolytica]WEF34864.1 SGNH/GDSL hydrolase family protein [Pseudoduganella chitinolytica]